MCAAILHCSEKMDLENQASLMRSSTSCLADIRKTGVRTQRHLTSDKPETSEVIYSEW